MRQQLVERFLRYVAEETRSDASSHTVPSTPTQIVFAKKLAEELRQIGMSDVQYNEQNGFVTATLPATVTEPTATIGFIAHMDTADFNATNVTPQIHEQYDGQDLVLNETLGVVLSATEFPNLRNYIGQTLITTDGTTLLGADDKAGIAEIMTAMAYLMEHPEIPHGTLKVAFGPDEEIGRGADLFDVSGFQADFAYTMDGGPVGELQWESFNAAQAVVTIQGKNVHPGTAKDTMVNATTLARTFADRLPADQVPEHTEKREGFFHLLGIQGEVDTAQLTYIIRDFDRDAFEARKQLLYTVAQELNETAQCERVRIDMHDEYYNMGALLADDMRPVHLAQQAMQHVGIEPIIEPIRGGTDGSKLTYMGLPTPNIFAGGENFHGRYEFISVQAMERAVAVIIAIAQLAPTVTA